MSFTQWQRVNNCLQIDLVKYISISYTLQQYEIIIREKESSNNLNSRNTLPERLFTPHMYISTTLCLVLTANIHLGKTMPPAYIIVYTDHINTNTDISSIGKSSMKHIEY